MSKTDEQLQEIAKRHAAVSTHAYARDQSPNWMAHDWVIAAMREVALRGADPGSRLVAHAEAELRKAGLYDADSNYGGLIPEGVMELVMAHAAQRHSGGSHDLVLEIFNKVIRFKTLTPITSDPNEWTEVGPNVWQSKRQSSCFSNDGGKTWRDIDAPTPAAS